MKTKRPKIEKNQEKFFNSTFSDLSKLKQSKLISHYINREQIWGLKWISDKTKVLDYGCGAGTTIERFIKYGKRNIRYEIYGVDIAQYAIDIAKKKYPKYNFFKIKNNKIPQIKNYTLDGVMIFHVLHHSKNHQQIFNEVSRKLKRGGKFLITDLSPGNPFTQIGREVFVRSPNWIKDHFSEDLVIHGDIPDRYKVYPSKVIKQLEGVGFRIEDIIYGHLFFLVFDWVDRFIPITKYKFIRGILKVLIRVEDRLLHYSFFQNRADVFQIRAIKK